MLMRLSSRIWQDCQCVQKAAQLTGPLFHNAVPSVCDLSTCPVGSTYPVGTDFTNATFFPAQYDSTTGWPNLLDGVVRQGTTKGAWTTSANRNWIQVCP